MKIGPGLVAAFMTGAIVASADATVLYSQTGTLGDANWYATGTPDQYELNGYVNLPKSPPPPAFTGAYGTFSLKPVQYYFKFTTSADTVVGFWHDDLYSDAGEIIYNANTGTYDQFSSYGFPGVDDPSGGLATVTSHSASFEVTSSPTSTYWDGGYVTNYIVPDQDNLTMYSGELVYWDTTAAVLDLNWGVFADGSAGEPFSIVVYSSVPETYAWVLMILGFAVIGATIRMRRGGGTVDQSAGPQLGPSPLQYL